MNYYQSIQEAIDYIEENVQEDISLDEVANRAFMSLMQLYRVFYSLVGHPVKEYIRKRRISIAAKKILESDISFTSIALDSGFKTQSGFIKAFKKIVGMTPSDYKKSFIYYSFERVELIKENSIDNNFGVKRVWVKPIRVLSYYHIAETDEKLEEDALTILLSWAQENRLENNKIKNRYFGFNRDPINQREELSSAQKYGYEIMMTIEEDIHVTDKRFEIKTLQGGLYAVADTSADSVDLILKQWNRLFSGWLPKSAFSLSDHQYFEEFFLKGNKICGMNLYLPIKKKDKLENIEIISLKEPIKFVVFRRYGKDAESEAAEALTEWMNRNGLLMSSGKNDFYITYNQTEDTESQWWECGLLLNEEIDFEDDDYTIKHLDPGWYACLATYSHGKLDGILDILYKWIFYNCTFSINGSWFALYHVRDWLNVEENTGLTCFIPLKKKKREN